MYCVQLKKSGLCTNVRVDLSGDRVYAVMSVFYSPFSTRSQNFAVMNSCVAALSLFSSDNLTWSADS